MAFMQVANGDIALNVAVEGEGPLILCVHGFPELWYSWRHQLSHFAPLGFKVAALDVRGYGGSSRPGPVADYRMSQIAGDVAAVIDALGDGSAILFGHDWGAPIVWNTALLHPQKVKAVAGLSVPYMPRGEFSFIQAARQIYAGRFFYQLYFQEEGVAEAELEADVAASLRKIYYSASGAAAVGSGFSARGEQSRFLDGMIDPQPFPDWLSPADLDVFVQAFEASGFRGPLNRYRAQDLDFAENAALKDLPISQPACFVAGAEDPVRRFIPGSDLYARAGDHCRDFRGTTLIEGVGHWVQQEAPQITNAALEAFVKGL